MLNVPVLFMLRIGFVFLLLLPLHIHAGSSSETEISFLRDPSKQMTFDQVRSARAAGQFKTLTGNLGLGYTPDVVWLHLPVTLTSVYSTATWLEIMPPYLDDIRLFHVRPGGELDVRRSGDHLPQSLKEEDYRGSVFKLDMPPGRNEIYLRIQTSSTMAAIVTLWEPAAFAHHLRSSYFAFGIYFSLILTVLLFNAANWIVSRRAIFLVYVGYLSLNALQWLAINGFIAEFVFPEQPMQANLTLGMSLSLSGAVVVRALSGCPDWCRRQSRCCRTL